MTRVMPVTSDLNVGQIRRLLEQADPEISVEFFRLLDNIIRRLEPAVAKRTALISIMKQAFPQEVRGRLHATIGEEEIRFAENNIDDPSTYEIVKNPNFEVTAQAKFIAGTNLNSLFANGLKQNPNY